MIGTTAGEIELRERRKAWVREYHGTLARIARKLNTSRGKVREVLYGYPTKDGLIERELAEAGAPGMSERIQARRIA
jgi:hypothetical protein